VLCFYGCFTLELCVCVCLMFDQNCYLFHFSLYPLSARRSMVLIAWLNDMPPGQYHCVHQFNSLHLYFLINKTHFTICLYIHNQLSSTDSFIQSYRYLAQCSLADGLQATSGLRPLADCARYKLLLKHI
jgi:hypothetical protein